MDLSEDEIALLGGMDDDWYGLWEVGWYFNGAHPEWSREARTALLSTVVRRGLVEVFFGPLMTKRPPLEPEVAFQKLADPAAWAPPGDGQTTGYYVTTSATGVTALRSQAS